MKKSDIKVLISILVGLGIFFIVWKLTFSKEGNIVEIAVDNTVVFSTSIYDSCYIAVDNEGKCTRLKDKAEFNSVGNLLVIDGGAANMIQADCPDKICVGMPTISNEDECIVCMPNKVIVTVR